jgi:hypothetical protein
MLTALYQSLPRARLATDLDLRPQQVTRLIAEACDAVLRGGGESVAADGVCAATWQGWCRGRDIDACERRHQLPAGVRDSEPVLGLTETQWAPRGR